MNNITCYRTLHLIVIYSYSLPWEAELKQDWADAFISVDPFFFYSQDFCGLFFQCNQIEAQFASEQIKIKSQRQWLSTEFKNCMQKK